MGFMQRLFQRPVKPTPSQVAKERLQLVLVYDRVKATPELMEALKSDIIAAVSRPLEIDREKLTVTLTRDQRFDRLVAEIPIRRSRS